MNKFNYTNLTPFKWFVLENFPFIEADYDALTEWQLFCKIGKEINKIINSENTLCTQMENVTNAFIDLENYVNNYFDNLDVQEEINNKLNEMATDGTLSALIGNYVNNFVMPTINTIQNQINSLASGSPLVASSVSEMTDTSRVYVNTTDGHWYYYNGTNWVDGGVYQATEFSDIVETKNVNMNFARGYIATNGVFTENASFVCSDYINCRYGYLAQGRLMNGKGNLCNIAFYDENKNFIEGYTGDPDLPNTDVLNLSIEAPTNAYYVRFSCHWTSQGFNANTKLYLTNFTYKLYDKIKDADITKIYNVGANKEYTSFCNLLKLLQNDTSKKIIYIDSGKYNIFEELGGTQFLQSIPENATFRDVLPLVPANTKIIGLGDVVFEYLPDAEDIPFDRAITVVSPLNISASCEIENITIKAKNCRYCIHDETGGLTQFSKSSKKYKNVNAIHLANDYVPTGNVVTGQAYACGFDDGFNFEFEDCYFETNVPVRGAFSFHNRGGGSNDGSNIIIKNSLFKSLNAYPVGFGNVNTIQQHTNVKIENCHLINGTIMVNRESGASENVLNAYDLTILNSGDINVFFDNYISDTNIYQPKVYNN